MIISARSDEQFNLLPTVQLEFQLMLSDKRRYLCSQLLLALIKDEQLHI